MMRSDSAITRRRSLAIGLAALLATAAAFAAAPAAFAAAKPAADLVLVAGATGRTGRLIVDQLLARNYRVRALVRDAAKAKTGLPTSVEVIVGDVRDPATLKPAVAGVKYVISAIGARGMKPEPGNSSEDIDNLGNANLATAAKQARVAQFVLVSSTGTSIAATHPMEFMRPILMAKLKGETAVRSSGVPYTIVKPGGLTDDAGAKTAVAFAQGDAGMGRIARADVATVCIEALGRKSALRKSVAVLSGTGAWPNDWDKEFKAIKADSN
jgi:uncharacterized protein YbjT (DUF2867 family)